LYKVVKQVQILSEELTMRSIRTVRTHVQENGGAAPAVGVGIGIVIAIAIGARGKASLDRQSHDR
jgi:hypothetical protein